MQILFAYCSSSGVSVSVCFVQKRFLRCWFLFVFGKSIICLKVFVELSDKICIVILSVSVLYSTHVYCLCANTPYVIFLYFSFLYLAFSSVQPFHVFSSPRINSVMSVLCFVFVNCRNLSCHCFDVNSFCPSDSNSQFCTSICFVSYVIFFASIKLVSIDN